jgi:hypothetical protein
VTMEELAVRVRAMQATDKVVIPEAQVLLEQELRQVKAATLAEQVQPEQVTLVMDRAVILEEQAAAPGV